MDLETLKNSLRELHGELQSGARLDPETAALVRQLAADVSQLTVQPTETQAAERQGVLDRLLSVTEEFEESHPQLAELIGKVATALSRIGI